MKRVKETIIVEGRYDLNTLKQCVDAHIIATSGFGIFNNDEKIKLISMLAEKNGIIVLTDSDGAGFVIRNYLKGAISKGVIKHAYVPEIFGKEKRKKEASKSGLLGVEGMKPSVIINALRKAGATFEDEGAPKRAGMTKQDMYLYGLSGGDGSAERRRKLSEKIGLPSLLSANALLDAINIILTRDEFEKLVSEIQ